MKKYINAIIRSLILWAWKDRVRVFRERKYLSSTEEILSRVNVGERVKVQILRDIALQLYQEGFVEFSERDDFNERCRVVDIKIICIK